MSGIGLKAAAPALALALLIAPAASFAAPQDVSSKTSDNQSNNKADVELSAKIRKAIMGDKQLSMAAHNVKIISRDGNVTVRGQVKSDSEKDTVVAKARELAGAEHVTDSVTVAPAKSK